MARVILKRYGTIKGACIGVISILDKTGVVLSLQTLENDQYKIEKGTYNLTWTYSNKFDRYTYIFEGVSGRTAIRIHPANFSSELRGCVALGLKRKDHVIKYSRNAVKLFETTLKENFNELIKIKVI